MRERERKEKGMEVVMIYIYIYTTINKTKYIKRYKNLNVVVKKSNEEKLRR